MEEEKKLILKIENLEKRVSLLEKQLETISQINQSEKVKEYIASAEKASKIAKLLDTTVDNKTNDSQREDGTISDALSSSPIMETIDKAKEFLADIDSDVKKQIRENNDEANKYDWNTLFDYEEVDGQITIKSYIGFDDLDVVVIPDRINGLLVTKIGEKAFENCKNVKEVVLPKHLNAIGKKAFHGCGICEISLPMDLTRIDEWAFAYSKLESICITSGINKIAPFTFYGCQSLSKIDFSKGITSVGYAAFESCEKLSKIDLPDSVKIIEEKAFYNIGKMENQWESNNISLRIPNSVENMYGLNEDEYGNIFGTFKYRFTIYCNAGSTAMKYARKYSIPVKRYEEFDLLEE